MKYCGEMSLKINLHLKMKDMNIQQVTFEVATFGKGRVNGEGEGG
jgi:hypothetical protein